MVNSELLCDICRQFGIDGELVETKTLTDGHINTTVCVTFEKDGKREKFLVQRINTNVFKDQDALMQNIVNVTHFLRKKIRAAGGDPERETLHFLKTTSGALYFKNESGCWRIYRFIDNSYTYNMIDSIEVFQNAGESFGKFQKLLNDYPSETLRETIPDFHNTPKRVQNLESSVKADPKKRAAGVQKEIDFALSRKGKAGLAVELCEKGEIPLRVTHNDTKLNNILFDADTHKGLCVIDLDTIMPGLSLYDFGDAIRFGAKTAEEDEPDLSKVSVSLPLYEAFTRGYLESCAAALTRAEVDSLAYSAFLMTYECGVRFLTDYIDGDVYFKTAYPEHNLVRARNQFKMVEEIEKSLDEMNRITKKIYNEIMD